MHILSKLLKKKMVTNLVILDEMIKSSSKKYDEMINLLKPPYRHQPQKKKRAENLMYF